MEKYVILCLQKKTLFNNYFLCIMDILATFWRHFGDMHTFFIQNGGKDK